MPERQPPRVSDDSPIGPDVDLERDDIRLADGTRLTPDIAAGIADDVRRAAIIDWTGSAAYTRCIRTMVIRSPSTSYSTR